MSPAVLPSPPALAPARGRPRKSPEERDDGNRRRELLAAAGRLFRLQGFAATSTRDIAAAAGMCSGSPFYHFENKQALLAAVMQEGMRHALLQQGAALAQLAPRATPRQQLEALVRHHFEVLLGTESDFVPVMLYEWRALDASQIGEINALKDRYEGAWAPVLERLHAVGQLASDPSIARLLILGALNWSVQWYQAPAPKPLPALQTGAKANLDELTAAALQLFLKPA